MLFLCLKYVHQRDNADFQAIFGPICSVLSPIYHWDWTHQWDTADFHVIFEPIRIVTPFHHSEWIHQWDAADFHVIFGPVSSIGIDPNLPFSANRYKLLFLQYCIEKPQNRCHKCAILRQNFAALSPEPIIMHNWPFEREKEQLFLLIFWINATVHFMLILTSRRVWLVQWCLFSLLYDQSEYISEFYFRWNSS